MGQQAKVTELVTGVVLGKGKHGVPHSLGQGLPAGDLSRSGLIRKHRPK